MKDYISAKQLNEESAEFLARLTVAFATEVADRLKELSKTGDIQTNDLNDILSELGLDSFKAKILDKLGEIRRAKKQEKFDLLKDQPFVSKNYHFGFARQLLASKHREAVPHMNGDYSDTVDE